MPVFNIAPAPGEPAAFAFNALFFPVRLDTSVLSDGEYNVRVTAPDITTARRRLHDLGHDLGGSRRTQRPRARRRRQEPEPRGIPRHRRASRRSALVAPASKNSMTAEVMRIQIVD